MYSLDYRVPLRLSNGQVVIGYQHHARRANTTQVVFFVNDSVCVQVEYSCEKPLQDDVRCLEAMLRGADKAKKQGFIQLIRRQFGIFDCKRHQQDLSAEFYEAQRIDPSFDDLTLWSIDAYYVYGHPSLVLELKSNPDTAFEVTCPVLIQDIVERHNLTASRFRKITADTPGFHQILEKVAPL